MALRGGGKLCAFMEKENQGFFATKAEKKKGRGTNGAIKNAQVQKMVSRSGKVSTHPAGGTCRKKVSGARKPLRSATFRTPPYLCIGGVITCSRAHHQAREVGDARR